MNSKIKVISLVCMCGLMTQCANVPLQPGAQNVRFTHSVPRGCQLLGEVYTKDIGGITTMYASHEQLQAMQMNVIRNQAARMGANVIVLTDHNSVHGSPQYMLSEGDFTTNTYEIMHQMGGTAYWCR